MRLLAAVGIAFVVLLVGAPAAGAVLAITAPASKALGSHATGSGTVTAQLGTVTASNSGALVPSFTVTVTCTAFKTGAGTTNETVPCSAISYWSGPATAQSGTFSSVTPGQVDAAHAVTLAASRTAFSANALVAGVSVSFNPTAILNIPASAVAGAYTGTITHSVA